MIAHRFKEATYLQFTQLSAYSAQLSHFVSTRLGGFSDGPYNGLNLGRGTADDRRLVEQNYQLLGGLLGWDNRPWCVPGQIHSKTVTLVTPDNAASFCNPDRSTVPKADALITNSTGIALTVLSADCTTILLYDPVRQAIGAIHAGWRGTVQHIAAETVRAMQHHFDTNPADLRVGIAPCIGMPVYEVGDEVVTAVHEAFGTLDQLVTYHPASGKPHFNLKSANRQSLIQAGVRPNHIEIAPYCSYDDDDWFYSHRRDKGITGRFGSGLMLLPQ